MTPTEPGPNPAPRPSQYRVIAAARARRDLQRLPEAVAAAVYEFVDTALAGNPHRVGKPLLAPFQGLHSARRGSYRIVYRIDDDTSTVQIAWIDHRADVYRPH